VSPARPALVNSVSNADSVSSLETLQSGWTQNTNVYCVGYVYVVAYEK